MLPLKKSVISEIISAISALRTYPENEEEYDDTTQGMLDEKYPMVAHAIEHLHAAIECYEDDFKDKKI